ncbi:uncharacterized protein PHACADRAFT_203143 [Phanerochaete carnosa HHB-10118-sp]|uniref:Uncharacterized protein n=1 Tax=Phanerochaete carnosa (strain HHB-10118-sp) TaxID=650164 RepID=K5VNK3_PHACS|nr:uncharacterized protein PHACADRAFT_203143 [Phanerochaete carnosa HHB-10118-sp]EKM48179.1 hypothetical protein PHACADRAFT_203143 [Phanerochaete carnosa HHB-10118-sp]
MKDPVPHKKGEGAFLIVSDFISGDYGWLRFPDGKKSAQVLFRAGKDKDGYFTHENIIKQVTHAMKILQKHNSCDQHIFVFDNATTHRKHANNALFATHMSMSPTKKRNRIWSINVSDINEVTGRVKLSPRGKQLKKHVHIADRRFADGTPQSLYFPRVIRGLGSSKAWLRS